MTDTGSLEVLETRPGRSCPVRYRYPPRALRVEPAFTAETLYVVGGLYGNLEALHEILSMKRAEEREGRAVRLLFNGDFNWFNVDQASFCEINETVLAHDAIQGNVEAELDGAGDVGCGCAYPPYVDQATVDCSNAIIERLRERSARHPQLVRRLQRLPMHLTVRVGEERIGVIHGDPESLAGWAFAVENMAPLDEALRQRFGCGPEDPVTGEARVASYFRDAQVRAFACTHTCLPYLQDFFIDGRRRVVINNGSAGMPNFGGVLAGLITRVAADPRVPAASLYGTELGSIRIDALAVAYDQKAWLRRFLASWPEGSAAHRSYFRRIAEGPRFALAQALRLPGVAAVHAAQ